jgi:hypothetical protein
MLSHPPYSPNLAPDDFLILEIKNCNEIDDIQGCFIYPTGRDAETGGDTRRGVFSSIRLLYERWKRCAEAGGSY